MRLNVPALPPSWKVGALILAAAGGLLLLPIGDWCARMSYDLPFLVAAEDASEVVMLNIDPLVKANLKAEPHEPLPLKHHSQALRHLTRHGAKLVVYDVLFKADVNDPQAQDFARAIADNGRVVLAADFVDDYQAAGQSQAPLPPPEILRTNAAEWGIARLATLDPDFGVRRIDTGSKFYPSLSWQAAKVLKAPVTLDPQNQERMQGRGLNYYCAPSGMLKFNFDLLVEDNLLPHLLKNKIVVIGGQPSVDVPGAARDQFKNPFSRFGAAFSSGAQVHATTLLNLLHGDSLRRIPWGFELLLFIVSGVALAVGFTAARPQWAIVMAFLVFIAVTALASLLMLKAHIWFSWFTIAGVQGPLALVWSVAGHSIRAYKEKALLVESLGKYFSPARVKYILENPQFLKPGAERREVSMLFTDIQDFSEISAMWSPSDLVDRLNRYYETAIDSVFKHEGTVMDLIGDAIFAIWNAPETQMDHRERACRTAWLLQQNLVTFDSAERDLPLRTRVGLHSAVVCVGNIGSPQRFDYTAIGRDVNLASRLEGLNKQLRTQILATREIQKAIEGEMASRLVGYFRFAGFDQPVQVFELLGPQKLFDDAGLWLDVFSKALHAFFRKEFEEAENAFRRVIKLRQGEDGPSDFYCRQIAELRTQSLPLNWKGVISLDKK